MRAGRESSCRDYDGGAGSARPPQFLPFRNDGAADPWPQARRARGGRARASESALFWWRDAENPTRGAVGGEPQRPVRPVANIANAFAQPLQEALLVDHLVAVEFEPHQKLADQRADEEVAAPGRQQTAGIERHPGRSDRGHPVLERLLHTLLVRALVDPGAAVVDAVADHRPAVILALLDEGYPGAAARPMLGLPQLSGGGVEREPLGIAVTVAPDLRLGGRLADEGIVRRNRAIRPDANDLAEVVGEILRLVAGREVVAGGQKQIVVRRLHNAAAEMVAAGERACLAEDYLDRIEPGRAFVHQPTARERGARTAVHRLGVTEIDGLILREAAVEHDVEQAALARREHLRHTAERGRERAVPGDDAHAPGPLGDQHAAGGQEGERPGMIKALRHVLHRDVAGGGTENLRAGGRAGACSEPDCAHRR